MGGAKKSGCKISPFHHLNAKLKPLYCIQFSPHNACFKGAHTQPGSSNFSLSRQMQKGSLSELQSCMRLDLEKHKRHFFFFWVSVSFTQSFNCCSCPSWPSYSRLHRCNIATSLHHRSADVRGHRSADQPQGNFPETSDASSSPQSHTLRVSLLFTTTGARITMGDKWHMAVVAHGSAWGWWQTIKKYSFANLE